MFVHDKYVVEVCICCISDLLQ